MPIRFIPSPQTEEVEIVSKWGDISGVLSNQSDLSNALSDKSDIHHSHELDYEPKNPELTAHLLNNDNPHNLNKDSIGLSNVDNLKQLNREPSDFNAFQQKSTIHSEDIVLIEDSEDGYAKKIVKMNELMPSNIILTLHKICDFSYLNSINLQSGEKIKLGSQFPCLPGEASVRIKAILFSLEEGDTLFCDILLNNDIIYEDLQILRGKGEIQLSKKELNIGDVLSVNIKDNHLPAKLLSIGVLIEYEVLI